MEPLSAIGARVRTFRKRRGLTQEELAGRIGRSAEALSVLERGRSTPTLPVLSRLSEELAVPLRDFFDPAGPPPTRTPSGGTASTDTAPANTPLANTAGANTAGGDAPQTPEQAARQAALMTALLDSARSLPPPELALAADLLDRLAAYHSARAAQAETARQPFPESQSSPKSRAAPDEASTPTHKGASHRRQAPTPDHPRDMLPLLLRLYQNDRQALTATLTRRQRFLKDIGDHKDAAFLGELLKLLWER